MSSRKIKTDSRKNHCFVIQMLDDKEDQIRYFGGFYNETECNGTESETQCWENESWVDDVDSAQQFDSFLEAREWFNFIETKYYDAKIVLYGWNEDNRSMDESNWYPLKVFKGKRDDEI